MSQVEECWTTHSSERTLGRSEERQPGGVVDEEEQRELGHEHCLGHSSQHNSEELNYRTSVEGKHL